jgi:hypothetical protein
VSDVGTDVGFFVDLKKTTFFINTLAQVSPGHCILYIYRITESCEVPDGFAVCRIGTVVIVCLEMTSRSSMHHQTNQNVHTFQPRTTFTHRSWTLHRPEDGQVSGYCKQTSLWARAYPLGTYGTHHISCPSGSYRLISLHLSTSSSQPQHKPTHPTPNTTTNIQNSSSTPR